MRQRWRCGGWTTTSQPELASKRDQAVVDEVNGGKLSSSKARSVSQRLFRCSLVHRRRGESECSFAPPEPACEARIDKRKNNDDRN